VPAETSVVSELAGRYATALFDLARDEKALAEVADDLERIAAMMAASEDLRRLVRSPAISRHDQGRAMAALLERLEPNPLTARFIGVVARQRRLYALQHMIGRYRELLAEYRGETAAEVVSARPLSENQVGAVREVLARIVGRRVNLAAKVDAGLIGGLVVRVGSRMVDSSLRAKLQRLRLAMKGVG
jgi:F-type H+-transporting ATPase subunit delta